MLRSHERPLSEQLLLLLLTGLVPGACLATALTMHAYDPSLMSDLALGAAAFLLLMSCIIALQLMRQMEWAYGDAADGEDRAALDEVAEGRRLRAGAVPAWEWDLGDGTMRWSQHLYKICMREPGSLPPTRASLMELLHHQDRPRIAAWLTQLAREERAGPIALRLLRQDGETRLVFCAATPRHDASSALVAIVGTVEDITDALDAIDTPVEAPTIALPPPALAVTVEVDELLDAALARIERQASEAGLRIVKSHTPRLSLLAGDASQLEEMLLRLCESALVLTPRGGVIALGAALNADGGLRIDLDASGLGVAARRIGSWPTGLALAGHMVELNCAASSALNLRIARQLAERNGGSFDVASAPGTGATATIRFPAERVVRHAA
jgi:signal transduction histidine kinase